jgi:succinate dehydrogenase / fumarate reductase, cytochrome b subunit
MAKPTAANPLLSTIGLKIIMAVTGAGLFAFTIIHMLGNLTIFIPGDALNQYAHKLQTLPLPILWGFRLGLLLFVGVHIWAVILLVRRNRAAKPKGYTEKKSLGTTLASRSMAVSGTILLAFIIFHILHFTVKAPPFTHYKEMTTEIVVGGEKHLVPDVYNIVIKGFQQPAIATFYIIAVGLLAIHLSHGAQSMFRSIGLGNGHTFASQTLFARGFALIIFLGMAAVPTSVLLGLIK